MERSSNFLHSAAQECRVQVEVDAPRHLSRYETRDTVALIRSASGMNLRKAYCTLQNLIPNSVLLHKHFNKKEAELLHAITSLFLSDDEGDRDLWHIVSDLNQLNMRANGELDHNYEPY